MPNRRNIWEKSNPIVQELFKQVKTKLNGPQQEDLKPDDILILSSVTKVCKRTLNDYFGLGNSRGVSCQISILNELAKFIKKTDFQTFVLEEKNKRNQPLTLSEEIQPKFDLSDLSSNIAGKAALLSVVKNLTNSADLKDGIYNILSNLYSSLHINQNTESGIDLFTYDSTGKNIEFAFKILDFKNASFDSNQLLKCQQAIEKFKRLTHPVFRYVLICNTRTDTVEYKTIISEIRELETEKKAKTANFYDIKSFLIKEVAEHIDIEIRDRILASNQKFREQFQKQMDQNFYVEAVPFTINQNLKKHYNPIAYLSELPVRLGNKYTELEYSLRKQTEPGLISEKGWNFIISEFGFGKTSLLLNLYKKLYQNKILSIFLPLSFFKEKTLYTASSICKIILEILFEKRDLDIKGDYNTLMVGVLKSMLIKRKDIVLLFDGLDEHYYAYTREGLNHIFTGIKKLESQCFLTMRKEFWDDRQGDFIPVLKTVNKNHNLLFLPEWSDYEILNFVDEYAKKGNIDDIEKERINEFRVLIKKSNYHQFYGDIPKRPLFLKMLIIDIKNNQIRKRNLSEIYEQYLKEKFNIDRLNMLTGKTRTRIRLEGPDGGDKILAKIFSILEKAASCMFAITKENECIMMPSINENVLEAEIQSLKEKEFSITEILLNSILVPFDKRSINEFYLKFAHKSFQEYFFARAAYYMLKQPNHPDNLHPVFKSKTSDGVVTFLKGIIESKREKKTEFSNFIKSLSKIKIEDISSTSLIGILLDYFSKDILSV